MPLKASEKRQILQNALRGQTSHLLNLQRQRRKDSMPYLEVTGIVLVTECHPALLEFPVADSRIEIDAGRVEFEPLREHLNRWTESNEKGKPLVQTTFGFLDPADSQYDLIPLSATRIKQKDYSETHYPGGTIGELRRLHSQSKDSFADFPYIPIMIESDFAHFEWDVYRRKRA